MTTRTPQDVKGHARRTPEGFEWLDTYMYGNGGCTHADDILLVFKQDSLEDMQDLADVYIDSTPAKLGGKPQIKVAKYDEKHSCVCLAFPHATFGIIPDGDTALFIKQLDGDPALYGSFKRWLMSDYKS